MELEKKLHTYRTKKKREAIFANAVAKFKKIMSTIIAKTTESLVINLTVMISNLIYSFNLVIIFKTKLLGL